MPRKLFKIFGITTSIVVATLLFWNFASVNYSWQWTTQFKTSNIVIGGYKVINYLTNHERNPETEEDSVNFIQLANPNLAVYYHDDNSESRLAENKIDIYINLQEQRQNLREEVMACRNIRDPITLWKSNTSNVSNFTAEMDFERISLASKCGGYLYSEFLQIPPREKLYPFEATYLSEPPAWNISTLASHVHSTIHLVSSNLDFKVGDTVKFAINIADNMGDRRVRGGDRIKVWIKDIHFNHSISARIVDFDNGTYLATTVLPWVGTVRVYATLRQSREYIRALIYTHRALKGTFTFTGAYSNSKANESVPCSPHPIVPGFKRSELCDLTKINGSPWFCGRPSKPDLNCSDFSSIRCRKQLLPLPVNDVEDILLNQPAYLHQLLPGEIILQVHPDDPNITRLVEPNVTCNMVPYRATWHQASPVGYIYNKRWKSFLCRIPEIIDRSCFQNVHMIFYGDSNSRESVDSVKKMADCSDSLVQNQTLLPHLRRCTIDKDNFTVQYFPHSNPFHSDEKKFTSFDLIYTPAKLLNVIPSSGRYFINFNHYIHYTSHHISAYESAMLSLRESLRSLLKRNPDVRVVLRAPHVAEMSPATSTRGDSLAEYLIIMQKEIFKSLQDRVIYFPTWDITVASQDTGPHPTFNSHIAHAMLQFVCGRNA